MVKGSEAEKQRPHELLWMLWFDEKSISNVRTTYASKEVILKFACLLQVKLRCPAKGLPQPSIEWFKNDIPIENISRPGYSQDNFIRKPFMLKPEKWELKIHGLQKSDHGNVPIIEK